MPEKSAAIDLAWLKATVDNALIEYAQYVSKRHPGNSDLDAHLRLYVESVARSGSRMLDEANAINELQAIVDQCRVQANPSGQVPAVQIPLPQQQEPQVQRPAVPAVAGDMTGEMRTNPGGVQALITDGIRRPSRRPPTALPVEGPVEPVPFDADESDVEGE